MKFTIPRNELASALGIIIGAVENRQTMQILGHVLIEAEADAGRVMFTGGNLEIELQAEAVATVETAGQSTVPAKKLYDIVRNLPEGAEIRLEFEETKALLRCGRSRLTLPVLPAAEYPRIDDRGLEHRTTYSVAEKELKRLMQRVAFNMQTNDPRLYLNGMLLHLTGSELRAVAGSAFCMGASSMKFDAAGEAQAILPAKSATEVLRLLEDTDSVATIRMSHTQFQMQCAACRMTTKAVDSRYPDYERLINSVQPNATLTVGREALKRALTRLTLVSDQTKRGVRLSMTTSLLTLESRASQFEEGEDHVDAKLTGLESFEIGFSAIALAEIVSAIPTDEIRFRFADDRHPVHIAAAAGESGQYVVAPMVL